MNLSELHTEVTAENARKHTVAHSNKLMEDIFTDIMITIKNHTMRGLTNCTSLVPDNIVNEITLELRARGFTVKNCGMALDISW